MNDMMKEILITSSALILALLILRRVFRKVLSRRFQYALWSLVLLRLLVPVSLLPAADFSVLTATAPVQQAVAERAKLDRIFYSQPQGQVSREELEERNIDPDDVPTAQDLFVLGESDPDNRFSTNWLVRDSESGAVTRYAEMTVGPWDFLDALWRTGMVLMGALFLLSNLLFYLRLRKNRRPYAAFFEGGTRRVYLVPEGVIPSPCLFGRSVYITPAVAEDSARFRHVLAHESTHARHGDPVWSLLRCLCLTIYWFDPLVWIAARCSKTDCELACDESVLEALGEAERIPYGQTLLSLIPVKRVSNPMIAATTMTAGKKQLKDRITRIAQKPRQLMAAAIAVAVLAGVVSACTFTGGTSGESVAPEPSPSQGPTESALRSLTGEELRWFNEEFFNNHNPDPAISGTYTIRNQFANPVNLYDKPEDIDLHELFYCDGTQLSAEEYQVLELEDAPCPYFKLTPKEIDDILLQNMGLTLEETNKVNFSYNTYEESIEAYVWGHGDTNYCGDLDFLCGTREENTVKLYHSSDFSGSSWYCVTLDQVGEEEYHFISNQTCEPPQIPTPLPAGDPAAVIDLTGLTPYAAPAVEMQVGADHYDFDYRTCYANWNFDGYNVMLYRSEDGDVKAGVRQEDGSMDVFLEGLDKISNIFFYNNLLGHDGFFVQYPGQYSEHSYGTVYDYYYFNEDGVLVLLARCEGHGSDVFPLDLDGDGTQELCAEEQIFFQREGTVYEARLPQLLTQTCPELSYWDYASWDRYGRCLTARGLKDNDPVTWERYLYFDGENLLAYKDETVTVNHMVQGADQGVPAVVVEKAMEAALSAIVEVDGVYRDAHYQEEGCPQEAYDDWRLSGFYGPAEYILGGVTVQTWYFGIELHTTEPEKVVLAGGRELSEDGWTSPGSWDTLNTVFLRREADGSLTYLWTGFDDGTLDSHGGQENLARNLEEHGIDLAEGYTYAALQIKSDLDLILDHSDNRVTLQLTTPEGWGGSYTVDPTEGNGPYYRNYFSQPDQYRWNRANAPAQTPTGATLVITDEHWHQMLQFWEGSDLVMSKGQNREPVWYRAELVGMSEDDVFYERTRIFNFMRAWFDEAEYERYTNTALGDHGDGNYREVALAYLTLYEEAAKRNATPGSRFACTYVKVTNLEILEDQPESWFPADIVGYPHFAFSYDVIFVPENQDALYTLMAGNTGEYTGSDPDVPQGAFEYSRRGSMYLKDGHWYCAGVGTG